MNRGIVDLSGRTLVRNDDFSLVNLDALAFVGVQPDWYINTPWPFGQQIWAFDGVFSVTPLGLNIHASKQTDGSWKSGLICSVSDGQGTNGFKLLPGDYIEATMRLPNDAGLWPSFWCNSLVDGTTLDPALEVDVFEVPNDNNIIFQTTVHCRKPIGGVWTELPGFPIQATPLEASGFQFSDFRTYGFKYGPDLLRFTVNHVVWLEIPIPPLIPLRPMGIIIALAFGGGFALPVDPGPFDLTIQSVKVWR